MRTVIVSTDASFCAATRAAGWGAVVKDGEVDKTHSGIIRGCTRSCQAEALALTAGVSLAANTVDAGDRIVVEADSAYALDLMRGALFKDRRSLEARVAADTRLLVRRKGVTLVFRQVPAHSGDVTAAQRRNRVADALARAGMAIGRMEASA